LTPSRKILCAAATVTELLGGRILYRPYG